MLTELVIVNKQKQPLRWLFSTADFEAANEPMLTRLRAAWAEVRATWHRHCMLHSD
jgi:hypothetical protein